MHADIYDIRAPPSHFNVTCSDSNIEMSKLSSDKGELKERRHLSPPPRYTLTCEKDVHNIEPINQGYNS